MAAINVLKWEPAPGVFAWKFPSSELSAKTQLIVSESQEAIVLKEGKMVGPFPPGRHTLSTENYPLLNTLLKIPFGNSPFTAEVWFIERAVKLDIKWGTVDPIQLEDPKYKIMLPVRAFGQYGIRIERSAEFLFKLVGTLPAFTEKTITNYFKGIIVTRVKDEIAKYLVEKNVPILHISSRLVDLSAFFQEKISPLLDEYGLVLTSFNVTSITTDDSDPAVKKLKEALAKRAEMDIIGYNYTQMRSFDTLEVAAGNQGPAGGTMGAGLGMGMGMGMGVGMGATMGQLAQNIQPGQSAATPCPACAKPNPAGSKFCAHCGAGMQTVPLAPLVKCAGCGASVNPDAAFCPSCGTRVSTTCATCGAKLQPGSKFCPSCGKPVN